MRQVLVVVYSYTGTSRRVAQRLAVEVGWPIGEVIDAKPRKGWLRCVVDSVLRRRPAIRYAGPDPARFDAVVLVSPIWLDGLAAPMRTFVAERAPELREFAIVSVMGNNGAANAVAEISRLMGRPPMLHAAFKQGELDDDGIVARIGVFARAVERAQRATPSSIPSPALTASAG